MSSFASRHLVPSLVVAAVLALIGTAGAIAIGPEPAQAATLVGKPCPKLGMTMGDGPGRTVICSRVKKGKPR